jgi:hypothetical protein
MQKATPKSGLCVTNQVLCCAGSRACTCVLRANYFLVGSFGNGVVTVFEIEVVGAFATVVVTFAAVVVGGVAPPIAGIGVVTVLASVVAGNVVNDNAAFFVFGVVISVSVGESEPPQALMARRAAAVRARAVVRGEILITAT